jgi:hypothetical protein
MEPAAAAVLSGRWQDGLAGLLAGRRRHRRPQLPGWREQTYATPMPAEDYPKDAFVTVTLEVPLHGRIMVREQGSRRARVLWECQHDHATGEEAAACAGREIGRSGRV